MAALPAATEPLVGASSFPISLSAPISAATATTTTFTSPAPFISTLPSAPTAFPAATPYPSPLPLTSSYNFPPAAPTAFPATFSTTPFTSPAPLSSVYSFPSAAPSLRPPAGYYAYPSRTPTVSGRVPAAYPVAGTPYRPRTLPQNSPNSVLVSYVYGGPAPKSGPYENFTFSEVATNYRQEHLSPFWQGTAKPFFRFFTESN